MKLIDKIKEKLPKREVPKAIRIQRIVALCVIGAIFLAFVIAYIRYREFLVDLLCDKDNLQAFLAQFGGFDKVVFVGIRSFQTVIKIIPAEPLELAAGAFYGVVPGMLYCLLGSFIGSFIIIIITKKIGRKVIDLFVPIDVIDDFALFKIFTAENNGDKHIFRHFAAVCSVMSAVVGSYDISIIITEFSHDFFNVIPAVLHCR